MLQKDNDEIMLFICIIVGDLLQTCCRPVDSATGVSIVSAKSFLPKQDIIQFRSGSI